MTLAAFTAWSAALMHAATLQVSTIPAACRCPTTLRPLIAGSYAGVNVGQHQAVHQHLPGARGAGGDCLLHGADVAAEHQQEFPGTKGSAEQELYVRAFSMTSPSSIPLAMLVSSKIPIAWVMINLLQA